MTSEKEPDVKLMEVPDGDGYRLELHLTESAKERLANDQ